MKSILGDIEEHGVLVSDGGWGSLLLASGLQLGECPERWNVTHPDIVCGIARQYAEAGADMVTTNSFGASRIMLERHGLADEVAALNRAAAALSTEGAAGKHVIASIGPTGKFLITGEVTEETLYDAFKEQAIALEAGGARACCIETMAAVDEACAAIRAAKENTQLEILCTFTFNAAVNGAHHTMMGVTPAQMAAAVLEAGANIIGCNCTLGPKEMVSVVAALRAAAPDVPIIAQPNAGQPVQGENGVTYPETPEAFAALGAALVEAGANIVGGCCGTTPAHIQALAAALAPFRKS